MRKIIVGLLTVVLMVMGMTIAAPSASAHTATLSVSCDGLIIDAQSYDASKDNSFSYKVGDKPAVSATFGDSIYREISVPQDGATTRVQARVVAYDGNYEFTLDELVGPCGTPPTPEPPVCDDECEMPFVKTDAPKTTKCTGVIAGEVLNHVRVPRGETCVLVDSYLNGNLKSKGGRNVYLADTNVRGSVKLENISGDVTFGSKHNVCRYDPYIGGSLLVKNSHNVLICQASVCGQIVVHNNDGRITIRESSTRKLILRKNNRFVSDANVNIRDQRAIRVINLEGLYFIKNTFKRRVIIR